MNFSDDEDFFARAGEDEDDLLPFEGYECYQPPEEMPPEEEVIRHDLKEAATSAVKCADFLYIEAVRSCTSGCLTFRASHHIILILEINVFPPCH